MIGRLILIFSVCSSFYGARGFQQKYTIGRSSRSVLPRHQHLNDIAGAPPSTKSCDSQLMDAPVEIPVQEKVRIGSVPEFSIEGDSTEETPFQRRVVAAHFFLVALNIAHAFYQLGPMDVGSSLGVALTVGLSYVIGDFGTGVFHWSVDNYGSIKTPVFGSVCAAFQGHHDTPWTITFRAFANNVYKICYGTIPALGLTLLASDSPYASIFFALFINWWMMSQQFHKYSHMKKPPNQFIGFLQDSGIILSRKVHGKHHTAPFEGNYCIVNGMCNKVLDESQFFRHLEKIVYQLTGNVPNTWKLDESLKL